MGRTTLIRATLFSQIERNRISLSAWKATKNTIKIEARARKPQIDLYQQRRRRAEELRVFFCPRVVTCDLYKTCYKTLTEVSNSLQLRRV